MSCLIQTHGLGFSSAHTGSGIQYEAFSL